MKKSRFTETQIVTVLQKAEQGHKIGDLCRENGVTLAFIQPGKPTQNAFIERFNRTFRTEVLNAYVFRTIREVREHADAFLLDYNHHRPHEGLGNRTPNDLNHPTIPQFTTD